MPMSKSSFYHLLSSKQELYQLAVADLAAEVAADLHPPAPETFAGSAFWPRAGELVEQLTAVLVGNEDALLLGRMVYRSEVRRVGRAGDWRWSVRMRHGGA